MAGAHDGHRSRMRERFRREGLNGFADHEALELMREQIKNNPNIKNFVNE